MIAALPALKSAVEASLNPSLMIRTRLSEFGSSGSGACVSISKVCGSGACIALMLRV